MPGDRDGASWYRETEVCPDKCMKAKSEGDVLSICHQSAPLRTVRRPINVVSKCQGSKG